MVYILGVPGLVYRSQHAEYRLQVQDWVIEGLGFRVQSLCSLSPTLIPNGFRAVGLTVVWATPRDLLFMDEDLYMQLFRV